MNNPNENQVIDINNARISNVTRPSNANSLINDRNNQNLFNWCEEDGEFEFDDEFPRIVKNQVEVVQQGGDHHGSQPQPQLDLVDNNGDFNFEGDGIIGSGQISSLNNDQVITTITNDRNVVEGQKQNDEEEVVSSQPSPTENINRGHNFQFGEDLDELMVEEIGKMNHGNLCTAQNNEVPVQSVLIDQKDVVTLEDVITKSQSPEKVQKSKQTPQRGRQKKGAKKTRFDAEIITSSAENPKSSSFKYKNDQADQNDYSSAPENDPKTKSGRKVQRPEYFNPTIFGYRKKLALESKDFVNNNTPKKTYKKTGKRRTKHKLKNANFPQKSENNPPEISSEDKQMYAIDASMNSQDLIPVQTSNGSVLYDPNNPSTIYVDPEDDNIVCTVCCDGTSERQNWIVFCDKCDAPYHQRCHRPIIEDNVAEDSHSEWICAKCKNIHRFSKRIKVEKKNQEKHEIHEDNEMIHEIKPLQIGAVLTREQKVEYLSSLSQDVLVNLLLLAEQMEPNIPLYPANILGKYTSNMSPSNNETDDTNRSVQDTGELVVDVPSGLSTAEVSNLSTLDISTNLNPENIETAPQNISDQDIQQEPITPESEQSIPSSSLKEITEHSKDSYLHLYIKAMSEIGNPNGSTAQTMHAWIKSNYNVPENFSARAKKSLHYAVHKGIFIKNSRMTYKFNPDYIKAVNINENTTSTPAQNMEINVNDNDGTSYKEITTELQNDGETPGIEKQNSLSEIKDFNFYPNQEFFLDSILDANLLGKGEDTYTPSTNSQRSSLTNTDNHNAENDKHNVSITDQYNQISTSPDKQPSLPAQSQSISRLQKISVNTPMMINNEQTRLDVRLPPLAPKPSIDVLPSIIRNSSVHYQPSQQQITNRQNELISSSIGGNNYFSYSIIQTPQILPKKRTLPLPQVNNNHITKIRPSSTISPNYSILMPTVIRGGNQQSQQSQQMYDHTKIRVSSSSIPSLQSLPTMHNSTTMPHSPLHSLQQHQAWPSSFNPFYMTPQPAGSQQDNLGTSRSSLSM
ncbi:12002_t:CDS:2 [Funneliformis geosporum]|uniref:Histone H1 n=1 Tax=Funneliformis geosporum TaxID=1117311 RepID=A0A9W4SFY6_9GLOM|nr:9799_t:CDS:2 [Funneliformis geosporum]CAI2177574.1 12002_t:CDS:2 [Funneliformis geosporum]